MARSAKQKANDKRLGRMAKARARKSRAKTRRRAAPRKAPKRRKRQVTTTKRKVNKRRKAPKRQMAGKKKGGTRKKGFLSNIPVINNPMFKKAAVGVGTATLGGAILSLVVPQLANQPLVKPVLALAGGGVPGVIAQVLTQGGLSGLGIGGGNQAGGSAANGGFA